MANIFTLIEGLVTITRPFAPLGDAAFSNSYGPATDELFDLVAIRKDIHIETDQAIVVKMGSNTSPAIPLVAGVWDFTDEWTNSIYITTTVATNLNIYANG